jgi:Protein of unknown function (DUF3540).
MITEIAQYLGPAEVITPAGKPGFIEVCLLDGETLWAQLALALPYTPAVGDEVLVVFQQPAAAYVIGVLQGRGLTTLQVPADLTLSAPNGTIRLAAGRSVQLRGTESVEITTRKATVRATRLNLLATTLVQRLGSAYTWATGLLQFKSRRSRTVTDEGWLVRADHAHLKTTGNTCINGKTVHLG